MCLDIEPHLGATPQIKIALNNKKYGSMGKKHEQVKIMRNMEFIEIGSNDLVLNAAAMKPVNRYLMKRNKRLSNRYLSLSISNLKLESEINNL
jgi:hypothetical protein